MPVQDAPIDILAYDREGTVVLTAEAKSRRGTSDKWAAKLRRNMLAHGLVPPSKYFLIATPDRIYGWKDAGLSAIDLPPQFTLDGREALAPYFAKLNQDPAEISPAGFDLLVLMWLTDISQIPADHGHLDPSLASLSDSGLLSSLRQAQIEMNASR